jgi:predicted Zn-dependent peptidase
VETWVGQSSGGAYLSAMKEDTDLGLELLADILRNPAFPEDKIKLAREMEKAGISRRNDDPMTIARREAMKAVFGADHPSARHTEYATVAAVTQQDMIDFHSDWFHPDRMYLVVIGDFDKAAMVSKIEEVFSGWEKATVPLPADPEIPDFPRTVNVVDKDDLTQTTVIMGHKGIRADSPYYAGVQVGNRILGGGFSTRLFNEVRSRQGLAYSVGSSSGTGFRNEGLFMAFTMTKSETSQHASEAVLTEIKKMTTEMVTDDELARAKDGILNSEVFSFDSKREILDRMVMFERYGYEPDFLQTYQAEVKAMTKEQVLEATQAVWKPDQMTILAVGSYADWDGDFTEFGPVSMVDITIPEPAMEVPLASPASLEAGSAMMAAAADASGGQSKLAGIDSYSETTVIEANIQGMDMTFTIEKQVVYPDKVHTLQKTPFGEMTSVVNGDKGWSDSPMGKKDLEGEDLARAHEELQTDMLGILRNLDAWTFQALDPQDVEGKKCNAVYATGVGDDYRIIYLDEASNQVVMVEQPGVSPMTQAPVTQKVYIDSYMEADGFTMPQTMRIMYDDELFGSGTVESFKANAKVDMSMFE